MKYIVVFFTRTKNSQRIAEKISNKLSCELVQISDYINWKGVLGFLKAGYYSSTDRPVEFEVSENMAGVDEYIVVAPLWAGGLAPAARAFLKTIPIEKVHLVVTSIGNHIKNRSGYKSVSDITKTSKNEGLTIDNLVNDLLNTNAK